MPSVHRWDISCFLSPVHFAWKSDAAAASGEGGDDEEGEEDEDEDEEEFDIEKDSRRLDAKKAGEEAAAAEELQTNLVDTTELFHLPTTEVRAMQVVSAESGRGFETERCG